jgi:hypothetical protein
VITDMRCTGEDRLERIDFFFLLCFFPRKCEILDSRARFFRGDRSEVSFVKYLQMKLNLFFYLAFFRTEVVLLFSLLFGFKDKNVRCNNTIKLNRDGTNPAFDKELAKLWIIGRSLAADTNIFSKSVGF